MEKIRRVLDELDGLIPEVQESLHRHISIELVTSALQTDLGLSLIDLAGIQWNASVLESYLRRCKTALVFPEFEEIVELENSILPDSIEAAALEKKIKHQGEQWFIHKHDADPFPSNPHAHNYKTFHKLHLGNGELFLGKRLVGKLSAKSLVSLRSKVKRVTLPPLNLP